MGSGSPTTAVPVIYVFGNAPVDVADCTQQLAARLAQVPADKTAVLLYEPRFHHARQDVLAGLKALQGERRIVLGEMDTMFDPKAASESPDTTEVRIGGQRVELSCELNGDSVVFLYVGAESAHLTSILMRYSAIECFSYDPDMQTVRKEGAAVNKALMRR